MLPAGWYSFLCSSCVYGDIVQRLEPGDALCAGHWCRGCLLHYALGGPVVLLATFLSGGLLFPLLPLLPLLTCSRCEWVIQSRTRAAIRRKYNLPVGTPHDGAQGRNWGSGIISAKVASDKVVTGELKGLGRTRGAALYRT